MDQNYKKLKKQQQGVLTKYNQYIPGAKNESKSRKSSSQKKGQNYVHPVMTNEMMAQIRNSQNDKAQNVKNEKLRKQKMPSNKLEDYYLSSESEHDESTDPDSSTIASTDSDDEQ